MGIIYIMWNIPFVWKCKIGITRDFKSRRKKINGTTSGFVFPIWFMVLPFGVSKLESDLHRIFRSFKSPFRNKRTSGRTEWFLLPVAPVAFIIINVTAMLYWAPLLLPVWWYFNR